MQDIAVPWACRCKASLQQHFGSSDYRDGADMQTDDTGYAAELFGDLLVYRHVASGMMVWRQAIDLAPPGQVEVEVLFHYTDWPAFHCVAKGVLVDVNRWTSLKEEDSEFGSGVHVKFDEPARLCEGPILAESDDALNRPPCCIPILVPSAKMVATDGGHTEETKASPIGHSHGDPADGKPREGWMIRLQDEVTTLRHAASNSESRLRRAFHVRKAVLGPEHPETLSDFRDLMLVLRSRGKSAEADGFRRHERRSWHALKFPDAVKHSSETPIDAANDELTRARHLEEQGCIEEAELHYRRALQKLESNKGAAHAGVTQCLRDLARVLRTLGQAGDAELLLRRALNEQQELLGAESAEAFTTVKDLAELLHAQERFQEAEPFYRRLLHWQQEHLGAQHPDAFKTMLCLSRLLESQGHLAPAEPLCRKALAGLEATLGPEHAETVTGVRSLAGLCDAQGNFGEAEDLYRCALRAGEAAGETDRSIKVNVLSRLSQLLEARGEMLEAEEHCRHALEEAEALHGPEDPEALWLAGELARHLVERGKLEEAESIQRRLLYSLNGLSVQGVALK